jgi:NADPH-dependent 2,4-dienoyl-CoA reductase/sulfur reductase-like enzyme
VGDIARYPDPRSGKSIRIEHWVVAQRQGETVAKNILGKKVPFESVPFFWSQHYDMPINYVGHAEGWDKAEVKGDVMGKSCLVAYRVGGKIAAIASVYRDGESLEAEALMEKNDQAGLEALMKAAR